MGSNVDWVSGWCSGWSARLGDLRCPRGLMSEEVSIRWSGGLEYTVDTGDRCKALLVLFGVVVALGLMGVSEEVALRVSGVDDRGCWLVGVVLLCWLVGAALVGVVVLEVFAGGVWCAGVDLVGGVVLLVVVGGAWCVGVGLVGGVVLLVVAGGVWCVGEAFLGCWLRGVLGVLGCLCVCGCWVVPLTSVGVVVLVESF